MIGPTIPRYLLVPLLATIAVAQADTPVYLKNGTRLMVRSYTSGGSEYLLELNHPALPARLRVPGGDIACIGDPCDTETQLPPQPPVQTPPVVAGPPTPPATPAKVPEPPITTPPAVIAGPPGGGGTGTPAPAAPPPTVQQEPGTGQSEASLGLDARKRCDVQVALKALGYAPKGIDGAFGPGTRAAITRFQTARGFAPSGWLTRDQLDALLALAKGPEASPVQAPVCPPPAKKVKPQTHQRRRHERRPPSLPSEPPAPTRVFGVP